MQIVGIIRNPYDRLISGYRNIFVGRMRQEGDFKHFISKLDEYMDFSSTNYQVNHFRPCSYFYAGLNNIKLYNMENLDKLIEYFDEIGVRKDLIDDFPKANESKNLKGTEFYFDSEMLDVINRIFSEDFKLGKYEMKFKPFSISI